MPSMATAAYTVHTLLQLARLLRRARGPAGYHVLGWCQVPLMSCKRCAAVTERSVTLFLAATHRTIHTICVTAEPASSSQKAQDVSASKAMTVAFRPAWAHCKGSIMTFVQAHLRPAAIGTVQAPCASVPPRVLCTSTEAGGKHKLLRPMQCQAAHLTSAACKPAGALQPHRGHLQAEAAGGPHHSAGP